MSQGIVTHCERVTVRVKREKVVEWRGRYQQEDLAVFQGESIQGK